ncbi:flavin monoamine oxidase family protein [Gymnodinialimonas sp.]
MTDGDDPSTRVARRALLAGGLAAGLAGLQPVPARAQGLRQPTGYLRTNWSRDPFTLGSYSFVANGARRRDSRALAAPIDGRIFFAGEATHPNYNSTVHAAYETGAIAAEAVLESGAWEVAVIGAGISGLATAQALGAEGVPVDVIEARGRLGGRIWTSDALGMPLDLGASWVHGLRGNPLTELTDRLGMDLVVTDDDATPRGAGRVMAWAEMPDWVRDVVEVQHSAGADRAQINGNAYFAQGDYGGADAVLAGGYGPLITHLAQDLDIYLNAEVSGIALRDGGVRIDYAGGGFDRYDAVIVTVPLGVLQAGRIAFDPPLPEAHQGAVDRLGMGLLDKVFLRFEARFWDDTTWIITPDTGLARGQFNQWLNLYKVLGVPVLMAFNGARPARDLAALPDDEVLARAVAVLDRAYPA